MTWRVTVLALVGIVAVGCGGRRRIAEEDTGVPVVSGDSGPAGNRDTGGPIGFPDLGLPVERDLGTPGEPDLGPAPVRDAGPPPRDLGPPPRDLGPPPRDTGPPCAPDVVPPLTGAYCTAGTRACIQACTAGNTTCVSNCLTSGGTMCNACTSQNLISCFNTNGCQSDWNTLSCCFDRVCGPTATAACINAAEAPGGGCELESGDYDTCTSGAGAGCANMALTNCGSN